MGEDLLHGGGCRGGGSVEQEIVGDAGVDARRLVACGADQAIAARPLARLQGFDGGGDADPMDGVIL